MDYSAIYEVLLNFIDRAKDQSITLTIDNTKNIFTIHVNHKNSGLMEFKLQINNKTIEITPLHEHNINDIHIVNMIKKKNFKYTNEIFELMQYIITITPVITNYCLIDCAQLEFNSTEHTVCGSKQCEYASEELIIGNYIVDRTIENSEEVNFILWTAFIAMKSSRRNDIFEPFPIYFLKDSDEKILIKRGELSKLKNINYDHLKDFDKIVKIIDNIDIQDLIKQIKDCVTDQELETKIGFDKYILIRFLLKSSQLHLTPAELINIKENQFQQYKVIYPFDKEEEFKNYTGGKNSYLFHGSGIENWYSIMRNGLKICSQTKLMTAGAAHGTGVYLSDDFNTSSGYCRNNSDVNSKYIIGICEVKGTKEQYLKTHGIYVVNDEKNILLRYILCYTHQNISKIGQALNNIFNIKIYNEKKTLTSNIQTKGQKRLLKEYTDINNLQENINEENYIKKILECIKRNECGIYIELINDNLYKWKILMSNFDTDSKLYHDMIKYKIPFVEFEVNFSQNYPFEPPFVRVIQPKFKYQTGHITSKGALCMEILCPGRWTPANSVVNLFISIKVNIMEGDGQAELDTNQSTAIYTEADAKQSFEAVARSHNWM